MSKVSDKLQCISPIDGHMICERSLASAEEVNKALLASQHAQKKWSKVELKVRIKYVEKMCAYFEKYKAEIAKEITLQMGRPIRFAEGEVNGMLDRARYMMSVAEEALSDIAIPEENNLLRRIQKRPVGTVLVIAPWNYPYLTAVNAIVPALLAGNSVILKHASHTPLCAERFAEAFAYAGLPKGVFQYLYISHAQTEQMIANDTIQSVAFTGSVEGGYRIKEAAVKRFIHVNLELGGKDPAYVREDVDVQSVAENLVEGAYFNSGQSCCGIERIYVHEFVYTDFVKAFVKETKKLQVGNPLDPETMMGPLVKASAVNYVQSQIDEAVSQGAKTLISPSDFDLSSLPVTYMAPQVVVDVDHTMSIMTEENFGPVVGIMPVGSDEEAVHLMNDSQYGLTASIWTKDIECAQRLCEEVETGTCFVNRCDYLDPALAWTGVKNTGVGCSLSILGFEAFTRPKSIHIRKS